MALVMSLVKAILPSSSGNANDLLAVVVSAPVIVLLNHESRSFNTRVFFDKFKKPLSSTEILEVAPLTSDANVLPLLAI